MEFEKAKKAVRRVLLNYVGYDAVKAATVVVAVLNDMAAQDRLAFKVCRFPIVYDAEEEQKN